MTNSYQLFEDVSNSISIEKTYNDIFNRFMQKSFIPTLLLTFSKTLPILENMVNRGIYDSMLEAIHDIYGVFYIENDNSKIKCSLHINIDYDIQLIILYNNMEYFKTILEYCPENKHFILSNKDDIKCIGCYQRFSPIEKYQFIHIILNACQCATVKNTNSLYVSKITESVINQIQKKQKIYNLSNQSIFTLTAKSLKSLLIDNTKINPDFNNTFQDYETYLKYIHKQLPQNEYDEYEFDAYDCL